MLRITTCYWPRLGLLVANVDIPCGSAGMRTVVVGGMEAPATWDGRGACPGEATGYLEMNMNRKTDHLLEDDGTFSRLDLAPFALKSMVEG